MLALSDAGWGFLGLLIIQLFAFAALFVRQGRNGKGIAQINTAVNHQGAGEPTQINTAVNHQGAGEPTLIERVVTVEAAVATAGAHRHWEKQAFTTLARHVGCILPPYPDLPRPAPSRHPDRSPIEGEE